MSRFFHLLPEAVFAVGLVITGLWLAL